MKKHQLIVSVVTLLTLNNTISPCPCTTATEDTRPFFEQYDTDNSIHEKNESTVEEEPIKNKKATES